MIEDQLTAVVIILTAAMLGQVLASRFRIPAIIPLLMVGFLLGPATQTLDPDALLGPLLPVFVSLSVAIILFEGGLSIDRVQLFQVGSVPLRLLLIAAPVTVIGTAVTLNALLEISFAVGMLAGAILIVTGPTVIGPLLRNVRLVGKVGPILKTEGILSDPFGALVAIFVFDAFVVSVGAASPWEAIAGFSYSVVAGVGVGVVMGWLLGRFYKNELVSEHIETSVTLAAVSLTYFVAETLHHEAGLLATTAAGFVLGLTPGIDTRRLLEFKKNIGVLLTSLLFVVLTARLDIATFLELGPYYWAFVGILVVAIRPIGVLLSTFGTSVTWRERCFLAAIAPRGVVAFAIGSFFALELERIAAPGAASFLPIVVASVAGTVLFSGIVAKPLSRLLGISVTERDGYLIVGASDWVRDLARAIQRYGGNVVLVDRSESNVRAASAEGIPAICEDVFLRDLLDYLNFGNIGYLFAFTPNSKINSRVHRILSKRYSIPAESTYTLAPERVSDSPLPAELSSITFAQMVELRFKGYHVQSFALETADDVRRVQRAIGTQLVPLIAVHDGKIFPFSAETSSSLEPGWTVAGFAAEIEGLQAEAV